MQNTGGYSSSWIPWTYHPSTGNAWTAGDVASGVVGLGDTGAAYHLSNGASVQNPMGIVTDAFARNALNQWQIENLRAWNGYLKSGNHTNFSYSPQWEAANPTSFNDPNGGREYNNRIATGQANFVRTHVVPCVTGRYY